MRLFVESAKSSLPALLNHMAVMLPIGLRYAEVREAEKPVLPLPTTAVSSWVARSIFFTEYQPSETYSALLYTASAYGRHNGIFVAGPVAFQVPVQAAPVPATVVMTKDVEILRTRWLPYSAT